MKIEDLSIMRKKKDQLTIDRIKKCAELYRQYSMSPYHCETKKQYIAREMGLSIQQTDRVVHFFECILEIQDMILSGEIAISCTDQIAHKNELEQKQIFTILKCAQEDGIYLSRDRIVAPIAAEVKNNLNITWEEIKPSIDLLAPKKEKIKIKKYRNSDCRSAKGFRFVNTVVRLMRNNGYCDARANNKQVYDFKCDAMATTLSGLKIAIQVKYHSSEYKEGSRCVEEAYEAKLNYDADIAIAVTSTEFTKKARKKAEILDVIMWDGNFLKSEFNWDGMI